MIDILQAARTHGQLVFILGNGGSAATASHFVCDLAKTTIVPDKPRFRVIALIDNMPSFSAWANDTGYENVFAEQLANFVSPSDVVIGISATGNSANVLKAMRLAWMAQATTIGFTGFRGGQLKDLVDVCIAVPNDCIEQIGDVHLILAHLVCACIRYGGSMEKPAPISFVHEEGLLFLEEGVIGTQRDLYELRDGQRPMSTVVFLDRDGVINVNRDDYVKSWREFVFLPGALAALATLHRANARVFVITNQAAIARRLVSRSDVDDMHARMIQEIGRHGGHVEAVLYCPHRPEEGCDCRKPQTGLLYRAAREFRLNLQNAYSVGDAMSDIMAGQAAGCRCALVLTGRGREELKSLGDAGVSGFQVVRDIEEAVEWVLDQEQRRLASRSAQSVRL